MDTGIIWIRLGQHLPMLIPGIYFGRGVYDSTADIRNPQGRVKYGRADMRDERKRANHSSCPTDESGKSGDVFSPDEGGMES